MIRVYTDPCCAGSERARELVDWALVKCPGVEIQVVDVTEASTLPESLFALPTWYCDSEIWMLGNPSRQELLRALVPDTEEHEDQ